MPVGFQLSESPGASLEPGDDLDVFAHGVHLHRATSAAALEAAADNGAVRVGQQPAHIVVVGVATDDTLQVRSRALDLLEELESQLLIGIAQPDGIGASEARVARDLPYRPAGQPGEMHRVDLGDELDLPRSDPRAVGL